MSYHRVCLSMCVCATICSLISIKIFVDRLWTENNLKEGLIVKLDLRSSNDNGCCHPSATTMWTIFSHAKKTTRRNDDDDDDDTQVALTLSESRFYIVYSIVIHICENEVRRMYRWRTLRPILWFELKHFRLMPRSATSGQFSFAIQYSMLTIWHLNWCQRAGIEF